MQARMHALEKVKNCPAPSTAIKRRGQFSFCLFLLSTDWDMALEASSTALETGRMVPELAGCAAVWQRGIHKQKSSADIPSKTPALFE